MFEGGITGFGVIDKSLRRFSGDELPKSSLPPNAGDCCVAPEHFPECCMECRYGGNRSRYITSDVLVMCGHPNAPKEVSHVIEPHMAKSSRQPWCPLTLSRFTA